MTKETGDIKIQLSMSYPEALAILKGRTIEQAIDILVNRTVSKPEESEPIRFSSTEMLHAFQQQQILPVVPPRRQC